jgi:hypothetical protein
MNSCIFAHGIASDSRIGNQSSSIAILVAVIAVCTFCWSSPTLAEQSSNLSGLVQAISADSGRSVDEIAGYLTAGRRPDGAEPTLIRWDQAEITLGLTVSSNASAPLVEVVVAGIQRRFDLVNRRLLVCVRSWPGGSEIADGRAMRIGSCGSAPTEIDLMIDVSDNVMLKEMEALPSDSTRSFLRDRWSRIRQEVLAQPTWHFCNFGAATDATAQKLVGAAAIIRAPTLEKKAFELANDCSIKLGYYLLGSLPIPDKSGGEGGALYPDLLALLYSDELQSGESRSDVLTTLREALGGN